MTWLYISISVISRACHTELSREDTAPFLYSDVNWYIVVEEGLPTLQIY